MGSEPLGSFGFIGSSVECIAGETPTRWMLFAPCVGRRVATTPLFRKASEAQFTHATDIEPRASSSFITTSGAECLLHAIFKA